MVALGATGAFAILIVAKMSPRGIPVPSFALFGIGIFGVVLSIVSVVRRDRPTLLIIVAGVVALFILLFGGGELLFPH
jgi:hypothetical protein